MEQLPLELILKIFGYLDLVDLFDLRLVCTKFEQVVKMVKIRELVFMKNTDFWQFEEILAPKKIWFFKSDVKKFSTTFNFSKYLLSSSFSRNAPFNVRRLKRLSINSLSDIKAIGLDDINRLKNLEHLEIGFDHPPSKSCSMLSLFDHQVCHQVPRLYLPNLRVLRIVSYYRQRGLEIDAPKLRALKLPGRIKVNERYKNVPHLRSFWESRNDFSSLQFKQPERIQILALPRAGLSMAYLKVPKFIEQFRNVQHLSVNESMRFPNLIGSLELILFESFARLKSLSFRNRALYSFFFVSVF